MKKYHELRQLRFDRSVPDYQELINLIEEFYLKAAGLLTHPDQTYNIVTSISMNVSERTPALMRFIADYAWYTGIPITTKQTDEALIITITEK